LLREISADADVQVNRIFSSRQAKFTEALFLEKKDYHFHCGFATDLNGVKLNHNVMQRTRKNYSLFLSGQHGVKNSLVLSSMRAESLIYASSVQCPRKTFENFRCSSQFWR
jgi:hypothetical protein